jgi:hypothetical protein
MEKDEEKNIKIKMLIIMNSKDQMPIIKKVNMKQINIRVS